jgi:hypothetical protein
MRSSGKRGIFQTPSSRRRHVHRTWSACRDVQRQPSVIGRRQQVAARYTSRLRPESLPTKRGGTLHMKTSADNSTWEPIQHSAEHGRLSTAQTDALPESAFAFPRYRKEPMTDASHVRSALARFNQVTDVSDADRDLAFANIKKAATYYNIEMRETDWRQLRRMDGSAARMNDR